MKKQWIFWIILFAFSIVAGCVTIEKSEAAAEAKFSVIEEDGIPQEMKEMIEEKRTEDFQITFEENENLYIGQGYGMQATEGYEIEVDLCRENEEMIYFHTVLKGPKKEPKEKKATYPYIVVQMKAKGKYVIFLNK